MSRNKKCYIKRPSYWSEVLVDMISTGHGRTMSAVERTGGALVVQFNHDM